MRLIDRRENTASILQTRNRRNIFSGGNEAGRRNIATISGIILHQTGFVSSDISRMDYVIANFVVMQDGTVLNVRDPSNLLNSIGTDQHAIDIEFVGNYSSASELSHSSDRMGPTVEQLQAGRELVLFLRAVNSISYIFAHAQFTPKNCPGPQIWYNVGEWAVQRGLSCVGNGHRVPPAWRRTELAMDGLT
jgi:hypothetical protein